MSEVNTENPNRDASNQKPADKKIKPLYAYTVITGFTLVLFVLGIMIGKTFFWTNYNKVPLEDRQISSLQAKLNSNPKDTKTLTDLGWNYFKKGDYNQALAYYQRALEFDKNYFPSHLNLGVAYAKVKKYELATESLKTALALNPKSAEAHANLGLVYMQTEKYQEAVNELNLANRNNPGNVEVIYQLGAAYEKLGKFEDAAGQYQTALEFDPKYSPAQEGLNRLKNRAAN